MLLRKQKASKRLKIGNSEAKFYVIVEDHYRVIYYEALDLIIQCIDDI